MIARMCACIVLLMVAVGCATLQPQDNKLRTHDKTAGDSVWANCVQRINGVAGLNPEAFSRIDPERYRKGQSVKFALRSHFLAHPLQNLTRLAGQAGERWVVVSDAAMADVIFVDEKGNYRELLLATVTQITQAPIVAEEIMVAVFDSGTQGPHYVSVPRADGRLPTKVITLGKPARWGGQNAMANFAAVAAAGGAGDFEMLKSCRDVGHAATPAPYSPSEADYALFAGLLSL